VLRAPLSELTDPARRFTVTHPSGFVGPAFDVDGLLVWGFTAGLLSKVLELAGLERAWDRSDSRPVPLHLIEARESPPQPRTGPQHEPPAGPPAGSRTGRQEGAT